MLCGCPVGVCIQATDGGFDQPDEVCRESRCSNQDQDPSPLGAFSE
jgi:hypothetical protein